MTDSFEMVDAFFGLLSVFHDLNHRFAFFVSLVSLLMHLNGPNLSLCAVSLNFVVFFRNLDG